MRDRDAANRRYCAGANAGVPELAHRHRPEVRSQRAPSSAPSWVKGRAGRYIGGRVPRCWRHRRNGRRHAPGCKPVARRSLPSTAGQVWGHRQMEYPHAIRRLDEREFRSAGRAKPFALADRLTAGGTELRQGKIEDDPKRSAQAFAKTSAVRFRSVRPCRFKLVHAETVA